MTDRAIDLQVGRSLRRIHRGVFLVAGAPLTDKARWMAALLACGHQATLSHESAGAFWGLLKHDLKTHVSIPRSRRARQPGIAVHLRRPMPQPRFVDEIRVTAPHETLVDLAVTRTTDDARRLTQEAARRRLIDIDATADWLRTLRRRDGAKTLLAAIEETDQTDSDLEDVFLEVIRAAGIKEPETQQKVHGFRVDFVWPRLQLIVETDGLTYHQTRAQQARDRIRDQRLTAAGYTCLRFTDHQVRYRPKAVILTLRRVMHRLSVES